jgi:hypothetical protein
MELQFIEISFFSDLKIQQDFSSTSEHFMCFFIKPLLRPRRKVPVAAAAGVQRLHPLPER